MFFVLRLNIGNHNYILYPLIKTKDGSAKEFGETKLYVVIVGVSRSDEYDYANSSFLIEEKSALHH